MEGDLRGYSVIGLDNPKNTINIGSVFRAAGCYEVSMVVISSNRIGRRLGNISTDTMKTVRHLPVLRIENLQSVVPFNCIPVAVDLIEGATPLPEYKHPERAFYIFGAEDATLGKSITDWCRDIVCIPTKGCMNLAATVNVVLYDRMSKMLKGGK